MARIPAQVHALVTGASSGIGAEFARRLAARGHDVVVVARRADRLEALRDELEAAHSVRIEPVVADLETETGRLAVASRLEAGGPWLLVNSAGFGIRGPAASVPLERELAEVAVNAVALHHLTVVALRANAAAGGGGGILNVASQAGFQPLPYFATYAATKAFVLHLSEALGVEARRQRTRVMALCPGPVSTEFFDHIPDGDERLLALVTMSAPKCVDVALRAFDRGSAICTPGLLTTAGAVGVRLVPRGLLRIALGRAQEAFNVDRAPEAAGAGSATRARGRARGRVGARRGAGRG